MAGFQKASHDTQNFGAGRSPEIRLTSDPSHTAARHLAGLSHDVFGQAFLNASRPSLVLCAGVLLVAALLAAGFRGGHSAAAARRAHPETLDGAA